MTVIATIKHVRSANLCTRGLRNWAARHGFDYNDFLDNGVPVERLEATNDEMALRVARIAREDVGHG